jgi:protein O-mannosyl-transferase
VWPHPLVFDYGTAVEKSAWAIAPQAVLLLALAAGTIRALWRRHWAGFLGVWFFAILAPSSSFVPIATQTMAEHRMYLPLIAVIVPVALGLQARAGPYALYAGLALGPVNTIK